ncbi:MAG: hypothetical protein JWQ89_1995 [Devosia sp.]|nr:hypothetical protein [Devosia sp.]
MGMTGAESPLPASPIKGEVPAGGFGTITPQTRLFTSPLVGEAGRGLSAST